MPLGRSGDMDLRPGYKGKKVLITGHTGFKGGWLCLWLNALGAETVGYALAPDTEPSLYNVGGIGDYGKSIIADIRDRGQLLKIMEQERPEFVFHLAAQPLVRRSYKDPAGTFETNVMGTVNILEAVRKVDSVRSCVIITSDKCYENMEWIYPYRENDPLGGHDPYSASKASAEIVVSSYRRSFFSDGRCGVATARAGNVIGGGDWAEDRIVPDCIRSLVNGKRVKVRNPNAIRPWQFVLDPLHGYLMLGLKVREDPGAYSEAWNFAPPVSQYTVRELVDDIVRCWGSGGWDEVSDPASLHEAHFLRLDSTKANVRLGWAPALSLQEGIERTVEWYKHFTDGDDMRKISHRQISEFMRVASTIDQVQCPHKQ